MHNGANWRVMFEYTAPENLLKDLVILITGASDGIGLACARSFASHGARVIMLSKTEAKLAEAYDQIELESPGQAIMHPLDLETASAEDYQIMAESIAQQFGQLDGLLHNAAVLGARSPIEFYPVSDWNRLMQVNVNAAFLLTRSMLPLLSQSPNGRILFTSSSVGRIGRAHWGAYAVSKFAVEGMMQTLADELEKTTKLRINSINPGGTRTNMRRDAYPAENPASQPAPEDLMPVYLFLMGPEGSRYHGQALSVRDFPPGK